jgi:hypothetical protein
VIGFTSDWLTPNILEMSASVPNENRASASSGEAGLNRTRAPSREIIDAVQLQNDQFGQSKQNSSWGNDRLWRDPVLIARLSCPKHAAHCSIPNKP